MRLHVAAKNQATSGLITGILRGEEGFYNGISGKRL